MPGSPELLDTILKSADICILPEEEQCCIICTTSYSDKKEKPVQLPCGHAFGEDCIRTWLSVEERKNTCPKCRYEVFDLPEEEWQNEAEFEHHGNHPFWNRPPSTFPDIAAMEGRVYPETEWGWITHAIHVRVDAAAMVGTLTRLSETAGLVDGAVDLSNRQTYEILVAREAVKAKLWTLDGRSVPIGYLYQLLYQEARKGMKLARRSGFSARLSSKLRKIRGGSLDFPDGPMGFFKLNIRRVINTQRMAAAQALR